MSRLTQLIEDMATNGYGVAWHEVHKKFWPFLAEGENIEWWHDPEDCASENFESAVQVTHDEMLRQLGP